MKLELFNASKCKKILKFHTYEIVYNVLLYVGEVLDDFHLFFQLYLTLNPFFSELSLLGCRPDYLKNQFSN